MQNRENSHEEKHIGIEAVFGRCGRALRPLSKEELIDIILGLAKEVTANQRNGFLGTIHQLSRGQPPVMVHEQILKHIEALKGELRNRIASIEDGSYYENRYQEYRRSSRYYEYDDESPDTLSEQ
jgi:hypothetical protein